MTSVPTYRSHIGTACVAHTRAYRNGVVVDEGFDVARVSDHLAIEGTVVWLDLVKPSAADLAVLIEELGLHPLAVEDVVHAHQRSKLDRYDDHLFLASYAVDLDPVTSTLAVEEVDAFITDRALVTIRQGNRLEVETLVSRWDGAPELVASGVAFLVHGLLDVLVDGHYRASQLLEDHVDALEDTLFDERPKSRELQRKSFQMRKALVELRRVVLPLRDVMGTLTRRDVRLVEKQMQPYFEDVLDHILRVVEQTDSLRDNVATILETNIMLQGNRLNEVMRNLSAGAALLAVTTAVTGFYGQNVPYPGYGERSGFITSTVILLGITVGLFAFLKRRGWL